MNPRSTVWVTGASSQLGVFLLPRLQAAGYRVLALGRAAPSNPLAVTDKVSWVHPTAALRAGDDWVANSLLSCGPLALAADLLPGLPRLRSVVAFSSSSVLAKAESADRDEREMIAALARAEEALLGACKSRGLPLLLLRPAMIYGCGLDRNVSLLARLGKQYGFLPLARGAGGLRQPVHADDLAALVVQALERGFDDCLVSAAAGGSTLGYRELAQRVAAALPRQVRLLTLPVNLLAAAVRLVSLFPVGRGLNPEMARRQQRDLVFDDSRLRQQFGWNPRPFHPTTADFDIPASARALQLPELMGSE